MPNPVRFPATHRFYWAGQEVAYICAGHLPKLKSVVKAMGYALVIESLSVEEVQLCQQKGSCPMPENCHE